MIKKPPAGPSGPATKRTAAIWIEPLVLSDNHKRQLAKWLDANAIEALRKRLELVRTEMLNERTNPPPTIVEQRKHIAKIQAAAETLNELLIDTNSSVRASLSHISHLHLGGNLEWRALAKRLHSLALGCDARLREMPDQGRRRAPVFLVAQVAEVTVPVGIRISSATNARFKRICDIALAIVGYHGGNSEGAIKAYLSWVETARPK